MKGIGKVQAGTVIVALGIMLGVMTGFGAPPSGSRPPSLSRAVREHPPAASIMRGARSPLGQGSPINFTAMAAAARRSPAPPAEPLAIPPPRTIFPENRAVPAPAQAAPPVIGEAPGDLVPSVPSPAPGTSFLALPDNGQIIPPDTNGAVGPNHVMTVLNSETRIQDRSGNVISTLPVRAFWQDLLASDERVFDPKTYFDTTAGRWIQTINYVGNETISGTSGFLVAASLSDDPTGDWVRYAILVDDTATYFADQSRFGFNKNALVVQTNIFLLAGGYISSLIISFDKSKLYASTLDTYHFWFDDSGFSALPAASHDPDETTTYLLETWNGNFSGNGFLRLSTITGTGDGQILQLGVTYPASSTVFGFNGSGAPQLGSSQRLDTGDFRIQSVVLRNGVLWAVHTVFLPVAAPTRSAVLWWKINTSGTTLESGLINDPSGGKHYAYPSVAVNRNNDVLIGFSRFSSSEYASAAYALRMAADPAFQAEFIFKNGEAPYFKTFSGTRNRWGDYSSTVVDPVDDTAFWTLQEYAAAPSGGQDRWGTWWAQVGGTSHLLDAVDDNISVTLAEPVIIDVLSNDSDNQDHPLAISEVTQGLLGAVTINSGTTLTYTPGPEFTEGKSDTFTYTATDGQGASDVATVTVTFLDLTNDNPIAANDEVTIRGTRTVTIPVLENDTDPDGDSLVIEQVEQGQFGSVTVASDKKSVIYTPSASFPRLDTFLYTVSDGRGGSAQATVQVKLLLEAKGTYEGGIANLDGRFIGSIKVVLAANNKFTAILRLEGTKQRIKGKLVADEFMITTSKGITVHLTLSDEGGYNVVRGEVLSSSGGSIGVFLINQRSYDRQRSAPQQGKYTMVAFADPAASQALALPEGATWARLSITRSGAVTIVGKMGDGTPFSTSTGIAESAANPQGETQLFIPLYSGKLGSVSGMVTFALNGTQPGNDFEGLLDWEKPPAANGKGAYPQGFNMQISLIGSRFTPPSSGTRILDWESTAGKGRAFCMGGNQPTGFLEKLVTLTPLNKVVIDDPGNDRMALKINKKTGLLTGSFLIAGQNKKTAISGVVLQSGGYAAGLFIGKGATREENQSGLFAMSSGPSGAPSKQQELQDRRD